MDGGATAVPVSVAVDVSGSGVGTAHAPVWCGSSGNFGMDVTSKRRKRHPGEGATAQLKAS
jgi:hypothetical protein